MPCERSHPGSSATEGVEDGGPRYSPEELKRLVAEEKAWECEDGTIAYATADKRDLANALVEWETAPPSESAAIRAYIKLRAAVMGLAKLLPADWQ